MTSKYISKNAVKGLNKIGDILIPGSDEFPSFSNFKCIDHVDDLLAFAPADDVKDLGMVLGILSFFPKSLLVWLIKIMANVHLNRGPAGSLLRLLNMGIRGIVFALYYSDKPGLEYVGKNPDTMIGFTLNKVTN